MVERQPHQHGGALYTLDPPMRWTALHGFMMLELSTFIDVVEAAEDTVLWPLMDHLLSSPMLTPEPPRKDV